MMHHPGGKAAMTLTRRPSPFNELMTLGRAMDRLFDDRVARPRAWGVGFQTIGAAMPLDVRSTADAIEVDAALPGYAPDDVSITVEDGTLTIKATARQERTDESATAVVREIRRGSVARAIALPDGLDAEAATATFEHGVLQLRIPRSETVKPRQIRITPTIDGQPTTGIAAGAQADGDATSGDATSADATSPEA
jgi:HSP20 family protein